MSTERKLFKLIVLCGVLANWGFSVMVMFVDHHTVLGWLGLDTQAPAIWLYNYSVLLIMLSCFYIPAAIDPLRYRANAWLLIFGRLVPATTFLVGVMMGYMPRNFLTLWMGDGTFGLIELVLLVRILRQADSPRPAAAAA